MRLLHLLDLLQPTHVAFPAVEFRTQEGANQLCCEGSADHLGADAEHVHVVVLHALVGRVRVVADRCADPCELAGRDRSADPRPADEDAAVGASLLDRLAELASLVRVVDARLGVERAEVDGLVAAGLDLLQHALAQLHATMVERDRNPHRAVTLPGWKARNSGVSSASSCAWIRCGPLQERSRAIRRPPCRPPISCRCCSRSTSATTSTTRTTRGTTTSSSRRGTRRRSCTRCTRLRARSATRTCSRFGASGASSRAIRRRSSPGSTWPPALWDRACHTAWASRSQASAWTRSRTGSGCCAVTARWPRARCGRRSSTPGTRSSTT